MPTRLPDVLKTALVWGPPVVALLMLVLFAIPAEVWNQPAVDEVYKGFDPNLVYAKGGGAASVHVSTDSAEIVATPNSLPSLNLITTPLKKFNASLDISVTGNTGSTEAVRVGVWSPFSASGFFVAFQSPDFIIAETIDNGSAGVTLIRGDVINQSTLGTFAVGGTYHVAFFVDKASSVIRTTVSDDHGWSAAAAVVSRQVPALFGLGQMSLTVSANPADGTSRAVLRNFVITLPHERMWASKISDGRVQIAVLVLALAGALLVAFESAVRLRHRFSAGRASPSRSSRIRVKPRMLVWLVGAAVVYLAGNALLFPLGGHPFDMTLEKVYAYVARTYGPAHLYYLPNIVGPARIWGGIPFHEAAFPYGPVFAYLFAASGWIASLLFAGGGMLSLSGTSVEYVIKAVNVLFGLADAGFIYLILRRIGAGVRWSVIPAGLFLFNPAVWFSMSIWGQTHVVSLFFVLAAILAAEKSRPTWAWLALTAACLTRPQMVVFGLLLGLVFLRKFSWRENVAGLSWTIVLTFIALLPLTLATSPSLPVDVMLNNFHVQEAGGNLPSQTTVSQDAYSMWPLVTYLFHGASGLARTFTPSSDILAGSLTYQRASQLLTLAAMLAIAAALAFRKRAAEGPGGYLMLVALGITSFLMLLTGLVATHFLLALPFLLLCRRSMGGLAYWYVGVVWTITTFVPMFGDMGNTLSPSDYPLLAPAHNAVTRFFVGLYSWDRFITVSVVANICAVAWIAFLAFRPLRGVRATA